MNPYGVAGIFQSTANQSANSFSDPMNIAHLYPGWRNNPNYQTPAHDAPYRPAYQGPNPYAAYDKPTFMGGISQLYSPFYKDPYYGNPVDNNSGAYDSIAGKPMDAAARIGQRFIAPAVAYGVSQAVFGGMGRAVGQGLGAGAAAGLGLSATGMVARGMGGVGGIVGMFGLPIAIGTAVTSAVDNAVFQPYIRARQSSQYTSDSFAGITFGSGGNVTSGRGLSRTQSSQMGSSIDRMGIMDATFSSNQFSGITSMGMRAGLFDDVNSTGDMTKRVSSIAAQIKTILAISKDPNIATAIEELSKLRMGGASISGGVGSQAMGAYNSIGMSASVAGMSVQRMMNTVGIQGQYMFQMNGITPYLGQMAASSAMSGFKSAERMGLISTSQLARMGGAEGATQSALGAQISASSTLYNKIGLINQYSGNGTDGVVNNVNAFGGLASRDPLKMMGAMALFGNGMISQQMKLQGAGVAENNAVAYLKSVGKQPGANGMYSAEEVAAVMQGQGMTSEQIQAYASLRMSQTDSGNVAQNIRAIKAQSKEQLYQTIAQNDLYAGALGTTVGSIKRLGRRGMAAVADGLAYSASELTGRGGDGLESFTNSLMFGSTVTDQSTDRVGTHGLDMDAVFQEASGIKKGKSFLSDRIGTFKAKGVMAYHVLAKVDEAARKGGVGSDVARQLLKVGMDSAEGRELLAKFLSVQTDPRMRSAYESLGSSSSVIDSTIALGRGKTQANSDYKDMSSENRLLDMAGEIHLNNSALGSNIENVLADPKYAALRNSLSGMSSDQKISRINSMTRQRLTNAGTNVQGGLFGFGAPGEDAVRTLYANLKNRNDKINETNRDAQSPVDWQSTNKAMLAMDAGSQTFLKAVLEFKDTVKNMNGGGFGMRGQRGLN